MHASLPHVVIVGGGFGGLTAARALAERPVRVTLLDRRSHHLFQPLLYQIATAVLNPSDIAVPLRSVLRKAANITVLLAEVEKVDHDDWQALAPGLKSLEEALEIRSRVLLAYEAAEREQDPDERQALLTFVIIGGGPTGVELAGALGEISRRTIARDFRRIDPTQASVILLEGAPRVLGAFPESLSRNAEESLRRIGVSVRTANRREKEQPPCPKGDDTHDHFSSSDDHLRSRHHQHSCRMCAAPGADGDDGARADRRACRRDGTRCRGTHRGTAGGDHHRPAAGTGDVRRERQREDDLFRLRPV